MSTDCQDSCSYFSSLTTASNSATRACTAVARSSAASLAALSLLSLKPWSNSDQCNYLVRTCRALCRALVSAGSDCVELPFASLAARFVCLSARGPWQMPITTWNAHVAPAPASTRKLAHARCWQKLAICSRLLSKLLSASKCIFNVQAASKAPDLFVQQGSHRRYFGLELLDSSVFKSQLF